MSVAQRIAKNWHWILLSLIFWYCGLRCVSPGLLDTGGDSAQYIIIGESLAQGKGLRMLNFPGEPFSVLAPGISVLLSGVLFFFGRNFWLMQVLILSLSYFTLVIFYQLFKKDLPYPAAFLLVANLFLNRLYWSYSHKILTEIPLLFFTGISFYAAARYKRMPTIINKEGWLTAAALLLAYFFRYVGFLVFLGVLLYLWMDKEEYESRLDKKKIMFLAAVFIPVFLVWQLRLAFIVHPYAPSFAQQFLPLDGYAPHRGLITDNPWFLLLRFVEGINFYASIMQETLLPFIRHGPLYNAAVFMSFFIVWLGVWDRKKLGRRAFAFYFLGYFLLISCWPFYEDGRYLFPILPFVFYFYFFGLMAVFRFFTRSPQKASKLLQFALVAQLICVLWSSPRERYLKLWADVTDYPPARNFLAMNEWVASHVADKERIISRKPTVTYLYTGHQSTVYPFSQDPDVIWQAALTNKIRYIIISEAWDATSIYLERFLIKYRDQIIPVHRIGNTELLKIKG